jgi:hypothetical protein
VLTPSNSIFRSPFEDGNQWNTPTCPEHEYPRILYETLLCFNNYKYGSVEVYVKYSWSQHMLEVSGQLHVLFRFTPGEKAPIIHCGPRAGMAVPEKRTFLLNRRYTDLVTVSTDMGTMWNLEFGTVPKEYDVFWNCIKVKYEQNGSQHLDNIASWSLLVLSDWIRWAYPKKAI